MGFAPEQEPEAPTEAVGVIDKEERYAIITLLLAIAYWQYKEGSKLVAAPFLIVGIWESISLFKPSNNLLAISLTSKLLDKFR